MNWYRHGSGEVSGDSGMAIVELAFAVPVLLVVTALGLWGASVARTAIVLSDNARDSARSIARGAQPQHLDPSIKVTRIDDGQTVTIVLSQEIAAPFLGGFGITVEEQATSLMESTQ